MNKESYKVIEWRKRTKRRIVESFGGKCCVCGYDKYDGGLALHHLNPQEKDFSMGIARACNLSWAKLVPELRKCVMVCHNCHSEIHGNISIVPENAPRFNEEYFEYKKVLEKDKADKCPVCGEPKSPELRACSPRCGGKMPRFDWSKINILELHKTMSYRQIAEHLNISVTAVCKRFKKFKGKIFIRDREAGAIRRSVKAAKQRSIR
jgi:hypothetical protein